MKTAEMFFECCNRGPCFPFNRFESTLSRFLFPKQSNSGCGGVARQHRGHCEPGMSLSGFQDGPGNIICQFPRWRLGAFCTSLDISSWSTKWLPPTIWGTVLYSVHIIFRTYQMFATQGSAALQCKRKGPWMSNTPHSFSPVRFCCKTS